MSVLSETCRLFPVVPDPVLAELDGLGVKKDRDRKFWSGGFLWSGQDYIGEPRPYDVFPVKASFFGAMDPAGFAKDACYLFRSQWTTEPMVHIVPMPWRPAPGRVAAVPGLSRVGRRAG
jgi:beta-galactosidase